MKHNRELKLQAWLDEELSTGEARALGDNLVSDAEGTRLVAELRGIREAMAGQELTRTVPETREFYWSKIARQIEREAQQAPQPVTASRWIAWQRWLATSAGFAALACVLLLAVKPFATPTFDEISATGEGMEAVTFHDQSAGMTVVWLQDTTQVDQPAVDEATTTTSTSTSDTEQNTVEME
jgi:hypothetical protein